MVHRLLATRQFLYAFSSLLTAAACAQSPTHRNVILISLDQCRADRLHSYGNSRETSPNLDRIASEGVRFERFYSAAPWTTPSYGAMMTSQFPSRHGATLLTPPGVPGIRSGSAMLAELFQKAGYHTGAFVNNSVAGAFLTRKGFDDYDEAQKRPTNITERSSLANEDFKAPATNQRVFKWLNQHGSKPFFLFILYFEPHSPYDAPAEDDLFKGGKYSAETNTGYDLKKGSLFRLANLRDADAISRLQQLYDAKIHFVDRYVGQFFDRLRESHLDQNTIVWITSDHGELLYSHPDDYMTFDHRSLYDQVMHVPGIAIGPGIPKGKTIRGMATHIDLAPTLLQLAGLPGKEDAQGRSLVPEISGSDNEGDQFVFGEQDVHERLRSVRNERFKLILNEDTGRAQLFDDLHDPEELRDVIKENPVVSDRLSAVLAAWRKENEPPPSELERRWKQVADKSARELVVDEVTIGARFQLTGTGWKQSDNAADYGGGVYWIDAVAPGRVRPTATWRSDDPLIGRYKVAIWYGHVPGAAPSKHVKFTIETQAASGSRTVEVDQTSGQGRWNELGTFDNPRLVRVEAASDGVVIADAVRFERVSGGE